MKNEMPRGESRLQVPSNNRILPAIRVVVGSFLLCSLCFQGVAQTRGAPLSLHPDNPHYFLFRGRPTVLITSGEHYGALLNLDFDYRKYLAALHRDGLNSTRVFTGAYVEPQGAFRIARNTLAPAEGRFIAPWARSNVPGYTGGGTKFDLSRWNEEYFVRLRDFMKEASRLEIIVEAVLFCPFYREEQWSLSPMNEINNINGIGAVERTKVYTVEDNNELLAVQKSMVRKIVAELNSFDNVYYEISNEPYFGGVTLEWQREIVKTIVATEQELEHRHLISHNVANAGEDDLLSGQGKVWNLLHPEIDILNFHYSNPPLVVALNYHLNRVIGENETGFRGTGDDYYRREAWEFILAGGALFNHLDFSFAVGHEDGTFEYPDTQPGGGSAALRGQFSVLKKFIESFDFVRMRPDDTVIRDGIPEEGRAHVLADEGNAYAIYIRGEEEELALQIMLPVGEYEIEWLDPLSGETSGQAFIEFGESATLLSPPAYGGEIALRILRQGD